MKVLALISSVLALGVGIGIWAAKAPSDRKLEITSGRSAIVFFDSNLAADGLKIELQSTSDPDTTSAESSSGFEISRSNLRYSLLDGSVSQFDGGSMSHVGGFRILGQDGSLDARRFVVSTTATGKTELQLLITNGKDVVPVFDLAHPHSAYDVQASEVVVSGMDMRLTSQGASLLGRPEWTGKLFGTLTVFGNSKTIDGDAPVNVDNGRGSFDPGSAGLDVSLYSMDSLSSLGRTGAYPNGENGLSMRTTSCNVGTVDIPWNAPMQVTHPVIAMNLYRMKNGRFEQIGWSWLKHGFLATNSNGCGTCQNPGTGSKLGPNCSDTYGVGNNGDRFYLGERKEVNPFTGVWTCQNSWFSNYQPDCVRRNNGSGLDPVAHRLAVLDTDLGQSGARYFYEAYYVCSNDIDIYNNIASREATSSWTGSQWNFQTIDSQQTVGPAIYRWGQAHKTATPRDEGDVIVAAEVTPIGNGMYHYEYAVYNHSLDRQIREFSVPLPPGATIQNKGFRDIDRNSNNQWTSGVSNDVLVWTSPAFGSSSANPLMYSSIFNFWFDSNIPPSTGNVGMTLFKPGSGTSLSAAIKSPAILQAPQTFSTDNTDVVSGNLASLANSDNDRMQLRLAVQGQRGGGGIVTTNVAPTATVAGITIGMEMSNAQRGQDAMQQVELWNWSTSQWELVDSRPVTNSDAIVYLSITSNPSRFVKSDTKEVRTRFWHSPTTGIGNRWLMAIDMVGMAFN